MNKINICYIDDSPTYQITRYLKKNFKKKFADKYDIELSSFEFEHSHTYNTLLKNKKISQANILLVDSRLFKNLGHPDDIETKEKYTGEKFRLIVKLIHPYIKSIIISQNEVKLDLDSVQKHQSGKNSKLKPDQYYEETLEPILLKKVNEIVAERDVFMEIRQDQILDPVLVESMSRTIDGSDNYSEFEKKELNELIELFQEVKKEYVNS